MSTPGLHWWHDAATSTMTYVVWDRRTRDAVLIDPLLNFDPATGLVSRASLENILNFARSLSLNVHWILETHVHADHFSAARQAKARLPGALVGIGRGVREVFARFNRIFKWNGDVALTAMSIDRFFGDGEEFRAGSLKLRALATPGHTPGCVCYVVGDMVFTGDALMPLNFGTGRCDFPGGSAADLYDSIWGKLYALPETTRVYPAHEYHVRGAAHGFGETIGEHRAANVHLNASTSREDFISFREARDKTLEVPRLLEPSLRWNLGGRAPA